MLSTFSFPTSSDFYATREDLQFVIDLALRLTSSGDSNSSFVKDRIRFMVGPKSTSKVTHPYITHPEVGTGSPRLFNTI